MGSDNTLWGAEFIVADYGNFRRKAHLRYIPLLGGKQAILEPWRLAAAWLYLTFGKNFLNLGLLKRIDKTDWDILEKLWKQPWTSKDFPEASNFLDAHSETIDKLLLISRIEKCSWSVQADNYDDYTVPYKTMGYCGKLLRLDISRDLGEGRLQKAMEKSFCLLRMAKHLYQQTQSLDFYYGAAYETTALQMIRYI